MPEETTIEVSQSETGPIQVFEIIPEKTVVVPEERKAISNDLEADIAMQEGVVKDKEAELQEAQDKLDLLRGYLKQTPVKVDLSFEEVAIKP